MAASQVFSGNGDPNGVVVGNPGDLYQDQTGRVWRNIAAPSTWSELTGGGGLPDIVDNPGVDVTIGAPATPGPMVPTRIGLNTGSPVQHEVRSNFGGGAGVIASYSDASTGSGVIIETDGQITMTTLGRKLGIDTAAYVAEQSGIGASGGAITPVVLNSWLTFEPPLAGTTLRGIAPGAGLLNLAGLVKLEFANLGNGALTLNHEDPLEATATNRFRLIGALPMVIPVAGGGRIQRVNYPGIGLRWVVIAVNK